MDFVKKHKIKIILLFVFVLLMIFAFIGIKQLLYPDARKDLYGRRLEGIEEFAVDNNRLKEISGKLEKEEKIEKINYNLSGRIINFIIKLDGDVDLITSQSFADKVLENFEEDEKKYFDFQVYLINDVEDSEIYPKIGYKHKSSLTFKWIN
ncbi:MAG: hypothetical protein PHW32_01395 [Bacilli bacterium]|nr:hypothetical protein [Bacilli bacterium]MDD4282567.1 hypothetical protein [Bacilli bacterium]MDD4718962.1 hypothetical protein [Bacilli bacterium]